jgi:hypothetical protein
MQAIHDAEVNREQSVFNLLSMTPITFYGKVVDEKNNPIAGAMAKMSAADHPYGIGSKYERITDESGLFSISGIHGAGLSVTVSKEGYYSLPQSWGDFGYAFRDGEDKPPHTDPNDPAIFVLRKMGETEPLIMVHKEVRIDKNGVPVAMDLHTGKTYGLTNSDIQVQSWTQNQGIVPGSGKHYDWRCVITVPGGGLQARTGSQFDFTAPTDGYQPGDEISMSATDPKWSSRQKREYYLKLANGEYARISFTMATGGYNLFGITSYLNPQPGHRNLEANPDATQSK